jgi:hypothetical protein
MRCNCAIGGAAARCSTGFKNSLVYVAQGLEMKSAFCPYTPVVGTRDSGDPRLWIEYWARAGRRSRPRTLSSGSWSFPLVWLEVSHPHVPRRTVEPDTQPRLRRRLIAGDPLSPEPLWGFPLE